MAELGDQAHLERIRLICLGFPNATEKLAWGEPTFRIGGRIFAMIGSDQHGLAVWCKSEMELRDAMIRADPDHYFAPPYVGHKGWIGIRLDNSTDWETASNLIEESFDLIARKTRTNRNM